MHYRPGATAHDDRAGGAAREAVPPDRRRVRVVFGGLALAAFLASLDQTIIATALPAISGDLGGLNALSWTITAFHLASAASIPLWGRISDLQGRKRVFVTAITVFLIGSVLSGTAQDIGQLIAFRALQGLGAGGTMTLAMAVLADLVAPRERGRYQGWLQLVFLVSSAAGPLVGGLLVDHASWRWVFYVNVPLGAVALLVVLTTLRLPRTRVQRSVDYPGAALLTGAAVGLLLVTEWGGRYADWGSPPVLALIAATVALLVAFVLWERRAREPFLPLRLFRDRVFVIVAAALFLATCALFAVLVFVPLFLQVVVGSTATGSGLLLVPMAVGITASTIVSGRLIARTGRYRRFPVLGLAVVTAATALLSTITAATPLWTINLYVLLFGAGFGLVTQVLVVAVQNGAQRRDIGVATASATFFRSMGASVGAALFGSVFAGGVDARLAATPAAGVDSDAVLATPETIRGLAPELRAAIVDGVTDSVSTVFLLASALAALATITVAFLAERPLRDAP